MIKKIENWYLQRTQPSFKDVEGVTAIDMVGKNTAKINEIIELVNNFTIEMETYIKDFTESTNKDYEVFKTSINQKIVDFIEVVDLKLASQDKDIEDFTNEINNKVIEQDNKIAEQDQHIDETITYIRENLTGFIIENVTQILKDVVADGSLDESIMNGIDGLQDQINTINTNLENKANTSDVYTKSEVDTSLSNKANTSDVYTKSEVDTSLSNKANTSDVYNKTEIDDLLANVEGGSSEGGGAVTIDGFVIPEIILTGNDSNFKDNAENLQKISDFINDCYNNRNYGSYVYIRFSEGVSQKAGIYNVGPLAVNSVANSYCFTNMFSYTSNKQYETGYYLRISGTGSLGSYVCTELSIFSAEKYATQNYVKDYIEDNVENVLDTKANSSNVYTKTQIDAKPQILSGTTDPTNLSIGKDGDVYFQYAE